MNDFLNFLVTVTRNIIYFFPSGTYTYYNNIKYDLFGTCISCNRFIPLFFVLIFFFFVEFIAV